MHIAPTKSAPMIPLIDLDAQHERLAPQLREAFDNVLRSGQFVLGEYVEAFEHDLARECGTAHAIGMSSGTDAILAALMALDIGPGDEVITSPFTWFSTAACVSRLGATPVFCDIHPRTYNLHTGHLEGLITERTKAIMPVHLYGLPANMEMLMPIAERYGLRVIEDAAQAIGAREGGAVVGSIGDVGCLSFYPTKNLSAMADAGACVTNDDELADKLRLIRNHGMNRSGEFPLVGGNFRMDGLTGAVLSVKLPHLKEYTEKRRRNAERYNREFERLPTSTPFEPEPRYHVYNQYTVRVRAGQRDSLQHHLKAMGIGTRVYYDKPLHLQACFAHLGYEPGSLPEAESTAKEVLSLPVYPEMSEAQQDRVIEAIREFFTAE